MSQNDFDVANQGFPAFRADMNAALKALASNSSGATAPSTTYAYMYWYDSTTNILKIRNAANDTWIPLFVFNQTLNTWSFTSLNVDNVNIDGNTISASDTNGDLNAKANGTGSTNIKTPSDTNAITVDSAGHVIFPLQSAFLSRPSGALSSVTGNGTDYVLSYADEGVDRNNDKTATTYTAPVASFTIFAGGVHMTETRNDVTLKLVTSNHTYTFTRIDTSSIDYGASGNIISSGSMLCDMDPADTATLNLVASGGAKTVDIVDDGNGGSFFSGSIIC